ncbi:MAG: hypothetical protein ACP5GU_01330 [Thermoprotei archaeon]|jgi:hypothetical protein
MNVSKSDILVWGLRIIFDELKEIQSKLTELEDRVRSLEDLTTSSLMLTSIYRIEYVKWYTIYVSKIEDKLMEARISCR